MSTPRKSRPGATNTGAAEDHSDAITASLHAMRRCILIIGYALLVFMLAATLVVVL